jgi:hypothetical protein
VQITTQQHKNYEKKRQYDSSNSSQLLNNPDTETAKMQDKEYKILVLFF